MKLKDAEKSVAAARQREQELQGNLSTSQADLAQARAAGNLLVTEADYQKGAPFSSQLSRAEVRAETLTAIANGEVQRLNSEHNAFSVMISGDKPESAVRTAQIGR